MVLQNKSCTSTINNWQQEADTGGKKGANGARFARLCSNSDGIFFTQKVLFHVLEVLFCFCVTGSAKGSINS